jgi:L-ascorbate metabolism protein UlaG (beta-lactamase superfamily)
MMADQAFEKDLFETSLGPLEITFIGHGSLILEVAGKVIHVDPYAALANYSLLPKADIILVTHEHGDHLDISAIEHIRKPDTRYIYTAACQENLQGGHVMKNGDTHEESGFRFEAVPAYNMFHKRENGQPFHPLGDGNGYVLTIGTTRLYIAGDTEDIPEMADIKEIDIAFLPMNLPYTMTPEMVSRAALSFKPRILYPYHYGQSSTDELVILLKDEPSIEVRIRNLQ